MLKRLRWDRFHPEVEPLCLGLFILAALGFFAPTWSGAGALS